MTGHDDLLELEIDDDGLVEMVLDEQAEGVHDALVDGAVGVEVENGAFIVGDEAFGVVNDGETPVLLGVEGEEQVLLGEDVFLDPLFDIVIVLQKQLELLLLVLDGNGGDFIIGANFTCEISVKNDDFLFDLGLY